MKTPINHVFSLNSIEKESLIMKNRIISTMLLSVFCAGLALTAASCGGAVNDMYVGISKSEAEGIYYAPSADMPTESYTEITENAFISTAAENHSYFSIDANTSSYPNLRSLIANGYDIHKDAVRVEEMLNYFDYDYEVPTDDSILALNASVFDTPYNKSTKLMTVGLAAKEVEFDSISNNLVFLIDTSGSMYDANKLPLVQQAFIMLAENLNPDDRVSIVTYAGSDSVVLDGAFGYETKKITAVIEDLAAAGSTAGSEGIETAYRLAKKYFIEGGNNRVILATDGDFNVGLTDTDALEEFISEKRESGVYFSVFGVGHGNLKADKMETLALNGNGTYSYIDSVTEARRALVEQIGGTLLTVAKDVKAGVEFNTEYVESYRLIGYENKLLTEEEFNDEDTDAGELGSGHTVTVVYELKLTDKALADDAVLAEVVIKYKPTENSGSTADNGELRMDIGAEDHHAELTDSDAFIASVVEFALLLRDSEYKADADAKSLIARLDDIDLSGDEFKSEFRELVLKWSEK